jgi:hypothetical protein
MWDDHNSKSTAFKNVHNYISRIGSIVLKWATNISQEHLVTKNKNMTDELAPTD